MFKTQQHKIHSLFSIAFWLLITLIMQPIALAQEGTMKQGEIHSSALEGNLIGDPATRPYNIYLPPSYETSDKRYPVIYVLHGYTQNVWALTNIRWTLDAMIRSRDIGEPIAVFVDGFNKFRGCWYRSSKTIDDEPQALFLFEEFFRLSYEVLTATSGEEGLKTLKQNPDIAVIVTFLFADVVGSTAIAAQIDAEVWTEIMNHVFEILSQAICC